jgi:hypothetical protein
LFIRVRKNLTGQFEFRIEGMRFFLLDSPCPGSLTLRDYSKVVAGYKPFAFKDKKTFPE